MVDTAPERLGELAIAAMLGQLRHETPAVTEFVIGTDLVERDSVRDLAE